MAGASRRFQADGYEMPKPFIPLCGIPMIHWVVKMFSPTDEFIFVALEEHMKNKDYRAVLENAAPRVQVISIGAHSKGPLFSCLEADRLLDDQEPLIVSYCDLYQHWNYNHFLIKMSPYDGGMAVFRGFHPASFGTTYYAYLKVNVDGQMLQLLEKQSFTKERHNEFASSGVYYIRSWGLFKKYANQVIDQNISTGGEYYVSLIYNPMVADSLKIMTYEVDKFICWGTPEDLKQFLFWGDFFHKDMKSLYGKGVNL